MQSSQTTQQVKTPTEPPQDIDFRDKAKIQNEQIALTEGKRPPPWVRGGDSPAPGHKGFAVNKLTNRQLKERELLMLLRKIKPAVAEAIATATRIMKNPEAGANQQLRAATILLDNYRRLTLDLYDSAEPDAEGEEIQQINAPVFSLKVIGQDDDGEERQD